MAFDAELSFTIKALQKMRLRVNLYQPGDALQHIDMNLRQILGEDDAYLSALRELSHMVHEKVIYALEDSFQCSYLCFLIPDQEVKSAVLISPYLTKDLTREDILQLAQPLHLSEAKHIQLINYYASLPVFSDTSAMMAIVCTLGETLWGGTDQFEISKISFRNEEAIPPYTPDPPAEETDVLLNMKQMEERYAYENELMEIVSRGLTNRAEIMMGSVSILSFEKRMNNPLRNMQNYCIICNTLLRKAAQRGGVHPLHLDRVSGKYAQVIESLPSPEACQSLIGDMIRSYCRLVKTHTVGKFSAIVQKVCTYIEENLADDLSLGTLSESMKVTPAYLSMIFHKETGRTLTEHIIDQRMESALQLLKNTQLQIQAVAQKCGITDSNYFTKLFKRAYGITPRLFREIQKLPDRSDSRKA